MVRVLSRYGYVEFSTKLYSYGSFCFFSSSHCCGLTALLFFSRGHPCGTWFVDRIYCFKLWKLIHFFLQTLSFFPSLADGKTLFFSLITASVFLFGARLLTQVEANCCFLSSSNNDTSSETINDGSPKFSRASNIKKKLFSPLSCYD